MCSFILVGAWSGIRYSVWPGRESDDAHTSVQGRGMVSLCCRLACEETNEVQQDDYICRPVAVEACKINQNERHWERERETAWLWAWEVPQKDKSYVKMCKWFIVQYWVSGGVVGEQHESSSTSIVLMCELTEGLTTDKPLCFHIMPLSWPEMKAWLVARNPHCSLESTPSLATSPLWVQDAFKQHCTQVQLISIIQIQYVREDCTTCNKITAIRLKRG